MRKYISCFLLFFLPLLGSVHQFKGKHYTASYRGCEYRSLVDIPALREAMIHAVEKSGATLLDISEHTFPGDGYTMVILLSESHASIHTYPEVHSCFVDLFTCGDNCTYESFEKTLLDYLQPTTIENHIMRR